MKIREEGVRVKEKFEEKVVKVCGEKLHEQSGIAWEEGGVGRRRVRTGSHMVMWGIRFFVVVFFLLF